MSDVLVVVQELNGARTPAEAIARSTESAWRRLPELRDRYDKLRYAQHLVTNFAFHDDLLAGVKSQYIEDELASDLHLANLDEVLPGWRRPDHRSATNFGELGDRRPWPTDDPIAQLVWLATSDAEPWLPTATALRELRAKRQARLRKDGPKPQPPRKEPGLLNKPIPAQERVAPAWHAVPTRQPVDIDD